MRSMVSPPSYRVLLKQLFKRRTVRTRARFSDKIAYAAAEVSAVGVNNAPPGQSVQ